MTTEAGSFPARRVCPQRIVALVRQTIKPVKSTLREQYLDTACASASKVISGIYLTDVHLEDLVFQRAWMLPVLCARRITRCRFLFAIANARCTSLLPSTACFKGVVQHCIRDESGRLRILLSLLPESQVPTKRFPSFLLCFPVRIWNDDGLQLKRPPTGR